MLEERDSKKVSSDKTRRQKEAEWLDAMLFASPSARALLALLLPLPPTLLRGGAGP
jgi:hypothetical protein